MNRELLCPSVMSVIVSYIAKFFSLMHCYYSVSKMCLTLLNSMNCSMPGCLALHYLLPAMWETWVPSLGGEDPLEKEMATHSSILAWRIPWTEEPEGYSPRGRKESDTTERLHFHFHYLLEFAQTTQSDLQIQGNPYQIINGIFHRTRTSCLEAPSSSSHW